MPFAVIIMLIIVANVALLGSDRYPEPSEEQKVKEILYIVFYFIFLVEMLFKLLGLGFKLYFQDKYNLLDTFVVLISTVEVVSS